ncbi:MAG: hypothetical protein U5K69_16545 [Balneolaceae bacterium]|nr:hypothetical protein [Balneolaceae bacterium]
MKEPQFFALEEETIKKYISWYFDLFKDDTKKSVLIDASTFYLSSERACLNIRKYIKNPRFVVIIRDPVKRAFSGHLHMKKKIPAYDKRTFEDIVKTVRKRFEDNAENLPEVENAFLKESLKDGSVQPYLDRHYLKNQYDAPFDSSFEDPRWLFKYFAESQYHRNIERLISIFGEHSGKSDFI